VEFTNAHVIIETSGTKDQATLNRAARTLTLVDALTYDFVSDADDYVVAFSGDGYAQEFTIASQTADTLTLLDPGNALPVNGTYDWVIRGVPKTEKFKLFHYVLKYLVFGQTQSDAGGGESGEP
jgi:hypothetical protein